MFISAQFMPWIVSFLFPGCFLFIYLFCLFLVHSFIYRPLQGLPFLILEGGDAIDIFTTK